VLFLCGSFVLKAWFYENLRLYHGNLRGERDVLKLTRVSLCTAQRSNLCSQDFSGVHEETLKLGAVTRRRDKRTSYSLDCKTTRAHKSHLESLVQQVLTVSRILGQSVACCPSNFIRPFCRSSVSWKSLLFRFRDVFERLLFLFRHGVQFRFLRFFERLCYEWLSCFI